VISKAIDLKDFDKKDES
jgi:hypothetical protein